MRAGLSPALIRRGLLVQGSFHIETELEREKEKKCLVGPPCQEAGMKTFEHFLGQAQIGFGESGSEEGSKHHDIECQPETETLMRSE